jgi:hypothetical protein
MYIAHVKNLRGSHADPSHAPNLQDDSASELDGHTGAGAKATKVKKATVKSLRRKQAGSKKRAAGSKPRSKKK